MNSFKPYSSIALSTGNPLNEVSHFNVSLISVWDYTNLATMEPYSSLRSLQERSILSIDGLILMASAS
jgi:hypothetical protein